MIYRDCRKEIGDNKNYYISCENEQKNLPNSLQKNPKLIIRTLYALSTGILLVAIILVISYLIKPISIETVDQLDCISNNLQNGGYVTGDNENAYFVSKDGIRKLSLEDGCIVSVTDKQTVHFAFERIYAYNGFLFYDDGFSFSWIDGSEEKLILSGVDHAFLDCIFAESPEFYFSATNRVEYWIEQYYNGEVINLQNIAVSEMYRYGDYLYIISEEKDREGYNNPYCGVWQLCIDGSQMSRILDFCPDAFLKWGETAYYAYDNELFICTPNSNEWRVIPNISIQQGRQAAFNVFGDQIYYIEHETGDLYKIRNDGKKKTMIAEKAYSGIYIVGDWIFYDRLISPTEQSLCKVKQDGSENQIVVPNWT